MKNRLSRWLIRHIILASQNTAIFRARGEYSGLNNDSAVVAGRFAKAEIEFNDQSNFLSNFRDFDFVECIRDRVVLDFGSGYGGRAAWMAKHARFVEGVEIVQAAVDLSDEFARSLAISNTRFSLGLEDELLFPDNQFDVIVSFDVLEHVTQPQAILPELFRVLKPDGTAVLIFTPYFGMFAHHLNYLTLAPALHWFFSPEQLVDVVNELLAAHPTFSGLGVPQQPTPVACHNRRRLCLPGLNGMTKPEYLALVKSAGFSIDYLRSIPVLEKFRVLGTVGRLINGALAQLPRCDEYFSFNLVSILRKPIGN
jgi:2-polyprenyl-3-methyl-5-hydroxy-6-metoxy-1,4-benzoquinol methylase